MPEWSEKLGQGYRNVWNRASLQLKDTDKAKKAAEGIIRDKDRYKVVEAATGVPWFWIGPAHNRESNRDFGGVLHNGQRIIGTNKKTTLVPKGRGPFKSWDEAAIDALELKNLHKIDDWTLERCLYEWERYNGFGYFGKINSPYVWASTTVEQTGKYTRDHFFDPNHDDVQLGTASILKALVEMDDEVAERLGLGPKRETVPQPDRPDEVPATIGDLTIALAEAMGVDEITVAHTVTRK